MLVALSILTAIPFYLPNVFLASDVSRFLIPILPFAVFVAGERLIASRAAVIGTFLSLPMIYMYAWSTLLTPEMQEPIARLQLLIGL